MPRKRILSSLVGLSAGAFLLWLVFRNTDWDAAWASIRDARPGYLLAAVGLLVLVTITRALRYRALMAPANRDPVRPYFSAVAIGEFADTVFPLRASVVVRPYVVHRLLGRPLPRALAAAVADAVAGHIGVAAFVLFTTLVVLPGMGALVIPATVLGNPEPVALPGYAAYVAGLVITGFVSALVTLLVGLWFFGRRVGNLAHRLLARWAPRPARRIRIALWRFAADLHLIRRPTQALLVALYSVLGLGFSLAALQCCSLALRLDVPAHTPLVTLVCIMVATLFIPNAPAAVGQFHASVVISLMVVAPETPLPQAHAVALVAHLMVTGSFILISTACMLYEGIRWRDIGERRVREGHPGARP